ncbi:hypothetical protein CLOHYLEM_06556 [[Clostridium] hylemonae DSM 15053]|uniref:Uncharacterized protein n=1 Tax=[Clostridium] hylemonae DSM 15053 TaxID=553973 RepID=C0C395_9FIRM|nr:hypothetical protein CLOHYLEM_06556 [[Clostridium] hylemonae DSM 15053]
MYRNLGKFKGNQVVLSNTIYEDIFTRGSLNVSAPGISVYI